MYSNRYTLLYALGFTSVVAIVLAVAATGLRPLQEENVAQAKRQAILQSVMEVNPQTLESDYNAYVIERVFDVEGNEVAGVPAFDIDVRRESRKAPEERKYPLYIFTRDGETRYIMPLQGMGLWGPIRAYLALDADLNTIDGVVFEHDKETPGLGAEISMSWFHDRYRGKKLFDDGGELRSVRALKGSGHDVEGEPHVVDGLTGATMTMNGVNRMMETEVAQYETILRRVES